MKRITGKYIIGSLLTVAVLLGIVAIPAMPAQAADTGYHVAVNSSDSLGTVTSVQVISVSPGSGFRNMTQTETITLRWNYKLLLAPAPSPGASLTAFLFDYTLSRISFGQGITVNSWHYLLPTLTATLPGAGPGPLPPQLGYYTIVIIANITIGYNAMPGSRNVSLTFTPVESAGPGPIVVVPAQPLTATGGFTVWVPHRGILD